MHIVLASASPRRREICDLLGIETDILPASSELPFDPALSAEENAIAVAREKAREIAAVKGTAIPVLGADTSVILDTDNGTVALGKPQDDKDAFQMLRSLQGRRHRVLTGVWVCANGREDGFCDQAFVTFAPMSDDDIRDYIATGECFDKAGSYAVQGHGCRYIEKIDGDFYTVMGLPSHKLWRFLQDF